MSRRGVVIVDGVRTPFCKSWGVLEQIPADELSRITLAEAMARIDLDPAVVDEVIVGNIAQPADTTTLARVAALKAGVPRRVPAFTLNQNCGSGIQAIVSAYHRIESGLADVILAGGVESMSRIPFQLGQGRHPISPRRRCGDSCAARSPSTPIALCCWTSTAARSTGNRCQPTSLSSPSAAAGCSRRA